MAKFEIWLPLILGGGFVASVLLAAVLATISTKAKKHGFIAAGTVLVLVLIGILWGLGNGG